MKKVTLLLCFVFAILANAQIEIDTQWKNQVKPIFQGLNKSRIPHEILLDFAMEFTNVAAYNGKLTDSTYVNAQILGNIYKTLFMAKVTPNTQYFDTFEDVASHWFTHRKSYNQQQQNTLVLAGLYYQYTQIDPKARNKISVINNKYYDKYIRGVWQNPYQEGATIAYAPPIQKYNKRSFKVVLPKNLFLSNNKQQIKKIEINFNDGSGYRALNYNKPITVTYRENGIYSWLFKTTLVDGSVLYSQTKLKIDATARSGKPDATARYENNVLIQGANASARLRIKYAPSHNGELKKPLIVAEGFDAGSILTPEIVGGDNTLKGFYDRLSYSGNNLHSLLGYSIESTLPSQEYDIVYVDWTNGTTYIQDNSDVLKNVIGWVNTHKVTAEPNVLLGQSMGGVIGRYTLAKMEHDGIAHDVRLFIAHDAPLQGSNVPLSMQYFSRHALDEYVAAPILFGGLELYIPLSISFPSPLRYLTLQDTPAAKQMNYHYVDRSSQPTMTPHNSWQEEFEAMGYPTQCRNVAISNGNECGADHGYLPRDKFVSIHHIYKPSFWGDLLNIIATPLAGFIINDPALTFSGVLPGKSNYYFDFDIRANPDVNQSNREVYWGKVRYEKKFLWLVSIWHTITNRTMYAPQGYLPFSTYSGGYINFRASLPNFIVNNLPAGAFVNSKYGFIPVVSALDVKRDNTTVTPYDYKLSYSGGNMPEPALSTTFNNFVVDFQPGQMRNRPHISFQRRNGDWLARELNVQATNLIDCSLICTDREILGEENFCNSATYSLEGNITPDYWTITEGSNVVSTSNNGNTITLTRNGSSNGFVTIKAYIHRYGCGSKWFSKRIFVGTYADDQTIDEATITDEYPEILVLTEDASGRQIQWRVNGINVPDPGNVGLRIYLDEYPCNGDDIILSIRVLGVCGWSNWVDRNYGACEDIMFRFSSNPMLENNALNKVVIKDNILINENTRHTIKIYDNYGNEVYSKTSTSLEYDVSNLNKGFYIVQYQTDNGKISSRRLVIE